MPPLPHSKQDEQVTSLHRDCLHCANGLLVWGERDYLWNYNFSRHKDSQLRCSLSSWQTLYQMWRAWSDTGNFDRVALHKSLESKSRQKLCTGLLASLGTVKSVEWYRWERKVAGTAGNHLIHPPTQSRLGIKFRPHCLGLTPAGSWKPPRDHNANVR